MPRWLRHTFYIVLLVLFSGCAGSCSGCEGCGVTPLPGGFAQDKRIENAATIRITDSGFDFIETNLASIAPNLLGDGTGSAVISFEVPETDQNVAGFANVKVCPGGPDANANPPKCLFETDLSQAALNIETAAPRNINVTGTLAVRLQSLPIDATLIGFIPLGLDTTINQNASCMNRAAYANIPVTARVALATDTDPTHGSRQGYTRISVEEVTIDTNALESKINFCGGLAANLANALKGTLVPMLVDPLIGEVTGLLEEQLCTSEDPAAGVTCPAGSFPDGDGVCRYCQPNGMGQCDNSDAECVSLGLGLDGNINLGSALAGISPGAKGGFDFLFALGGQSQVPGTQLLAGDLNPVAGGATISAMGGAEPQPITTCVPLANLERPTGIPQPDELLGNTVTGWTGPGPHFGVGVSERFLNYAFAGAYNSGALCLGVGPDTLGDLLTSDTIGLLLPSLKDLGRQQKGQPLAIVLRPKTPPKALIGNGTGPMDPLLNVTLDQLLIDFYIFASDRYIRAFTAGFDIQAPVNLDVNAQSELVVNIAEVGVNNPSVTNASLMREEEQDAADTLAGIVGGVVGDALGGAIDPIDLNGLLGDFGIRLVIPPTVEGQGSPGLRKLEKDTDRFLGIFAAFEAASNAAPQMRVETVARVREKRVSKEGLVIPTITEANRTRVEIDVTAAHDDGSRALEFQYRLNNGFWRPWQQTRTLELKDPQLAIQAVHKVEIRSRVVGQPRTLDATPEVLMVRIDKSEPELKVDRKPKDGLVGVEAWDAVSKKNVSVRWALDDEQPGEWVTIGTLAGIEVGDAQRITVEARDEEGNVASTSQPIIRGRQDPALSGGDSGCNCTVPGSEQSRGVSGVAGLGILAAIGMLMGWRRRRADSGEDAGDDDSPKARRVRRKLRAYTAVGAVGVALFGSGCSCSDEGGGGGGGSGGSGGGAGSNGTTCPGLDQCEVLFEGLIGSYSSGAVASDGTVWVAGYADIGYSESVEFGKSTYLYGDLVVGKWDGTTVAWEFVDGLPAVDEPPDPAFYDVNGVRGGLTDPGDDVGLWTSIAVDGSGNPHVAYYDVKNEALKFASWDGSAWAIHTVQDNDGDVGRYADMKIVGGNATIAYMFLEKQGDGTFASGVRIATGSGIPSAASGWAFADAAVDPATPCSKDLCDKEECRVDTNACAPRTNGCDPECGADEACFDNGGNLECLAVVPENLDPFPGGSGLYVSMAESPSGLALAYYDRVHGNVMGVRQEGGMWQPPFVIAGQADQGGTLVDTGDTGIGTSLFIDGNGDWHVAYANGFDETVEYVKVTAAGPEAPQVVDNGATDDGQAIVGDDTSITVTSAGEVLIAYQDATNGLLKLARGTPNGGGGNDWAVSSLPVDGHAGAFNQILNVNGATQIMTWWRKADPNTEGNITLVSP